MNIKSVLIGFIVLVMGFFVFNYFQRLNSFENTDPIPISKLDEKNYPGDNFFFQRSFPDTTFDIKAYTSAFEEMKSLEQQRSFIYDGFDADWTTQGPGDAGARINAIAVNPINDDIIYAGFSGGGIFKTIDGGTSWNPIFDDQPYLAISDITLDPANPDIVYVGTGDHNVTGYPYIGDGVYKSEDGGNTWQHKGLTDQRIISRIIVDPTNSDIIYAACLGLPFERNDERGLYKSIDGGNTWSQVLFVSDQSGIVDLLINPDNPQVLYAASWDRIRNNTESIVSGPNAKIYKTVDGGNSWINLSNGLPTGSQGRIGLAMSGNNPNTVFAMYVGTNSKLEGIYKSTDGGQNWSSIPTGGGTGLSSNPLGGFGWYFGQLRVDPTNDNRLYLLGVNLWYTSSSGNLWTRITPLSGPNAPHVDNHDVVFNDGDVYLGTDGGMYKRNLGSSIWNDIENIPATQFYRTAYNPHEIDEYYGGSQDNGTLAGNAVDINDWDRLLGGDGFQISFHPTDPDIRYAETQNGNIFMKPNANTGFINATNGIIPGDRRNWDMQYIISSHDPNVLYTGTYRVYKSEEDGLPLWSTISGDLTDSNIFGSSFHTITTLGESPVNAEFLYVGTTDGNVWRTLDGGSTWDSLHSNLPNRYVTSIVASPDLANNVFVAHSGYKYNDFIPHIHYSTDNGDTWQDISGDLPQLAVNNIFVIPNYNDQVIFVATDGGVFGTLDGGSSWQRLGANFPYVPVYDIDWNIGKNELIAATFGRAIMTYPQDSIDLSQPPDELSLTGIIKTENAVDIDSVTVILSGEVMDEILADGGYAFSIPFGADCTVSPSKDINIRNGVSTFDIVQIQRHILAIDTLDSPYKIIAGDVNHSNSITAFDLVLIRKVVLFISDTFPNNTSWRFVDSEFVFADPVHPFADPFPESINFIDLENNESADFIGLKVGDVTGNANPDEIADPGDERGVKDTLQFYTQDQMIKRGDEISIPIKAQNFNEIIGFQFTLEFDNNAMKFEGFSNETINNLGDNNFGLKHLNNGQITFSWNDVNFVSIENNISLFSLKFKALEDGYLSKIVSLNSSLTVKEAYNNELDILELKFTFQPANVKSINTQILKAYPNPFSENTTISFDIKKEELVEIFVYNLKGELVFSEIEQFSKGQNQFDLPGSVFKQNGIYIAQLKIRNQIFQSDKIIRFK